MAQGIGIYGNCEAGKAAVHFIWCARLADTLELSLMSSCSASPICPLLTKSRACQRKTAYAHIKNALFMFHAKRGQDEAKTRRR